MLFSRTSAVSPFRLCLLHVSTDAQADSGGGFVRADACTSKDVVGVVDGSEPITSGVDGAEVSSLAAAAVSQPKQEVITPSSVDAIFEVPLVHEVAQGVAVTEHGYAMNEDFPSVTKILDKTKSSLSVMVLNKWRAKMITKHGRTKFYDMQKERLNVGGELHQAFTLQYLKQKIPPDEMKLPDVVRPFFASLRPVLNDFQALVAREAWVHHSTLCYKGQLDALVMYKNRLTLLELKTSDKLKSTLQSTYDTPLQCVAYLGAWNAASPNRQATDAVLVFCYENEPATVFELNRETLEFYWLKWQCRVADFYFPGKT